MLAHEGAHASCHPMPPVYNACGVSSLPWYHMMDPLLAATPGILYNLMLKIKLCSAISPTFSGLCKIVGSGQRGNQPSDLIPALATNNVRLINLTLIISSQNTP